MPENCNIEFDYTPLGPTEQQIRLLRVAPDQADDQRLLCEIAIFSLEDEPEYTALSYCWGQDESTDMVWFSDSEFFFLRPNVHAYLELMDEERDSRWIFIDAICINQHDLSERSRQVALMGTVYR
ncbi:hypothetical protein LTR85_006491 [Meristemomyces frigidus]|nr:hypothetical protein LTR85_006491 [Meristemomyces frigidus]